MLVLAIESSCDETAAAVLRDGQNLLSNVIASQIRIHEKYGGVVPEIASRKHVEVIVPVILEALERAGVTLEDIEGIAVTRGPGLVGSLLVGLSIAKALAMARDIPFVGVNHLEGHIASAFLADDKPSFPFVALVVSGGHTNIYVVSDFERMRLVGQTRDDAAGEAFDKAAKLLNIGYPGGVVIDRLARTGDTSAVSFPRSMKDSLEFSFSGVKTALLTYTKKLVRPPTDAEIPDIVASYQEAIVDVLVEKTLRAAEMHAIGRVAVVGGVAANSRLRTRFREDADKKGIQVFIPPPVFCTDNAAMIAVAGHHFLQRGRKDPFDLNALSRWPIDNL
jgi:N6-L-threonylcarbamoyladenine synthase